MFCCATAVFFCVVMRTFLSSSSLSFVLVFSCSYLSCKPFSVLSDYTAACSLLLSFSCTIYYWSVFCFCTIRLRSCTCFSNSFFSSSLNCIALFNFSCSS